MNHATLASYAILLSLAAGDIAWAATQASGGTDVLWSDEDQWIRIERQDDPGAPANDHPASLSTASVANALAALRIRMVDPDTGTDVQRAVFTPRELGHLAPRVATGLAKAGPRQDLTFSTLGSDALDARGFIKGINVNTGRVFYQGGKLNVIFGELQTDYRKKNVYGRRDEDFNPRRQGARKRASEHRWTLAQIPGIALQAGRDGSVREDWVMIDPRIVATQPAAAPAVHQPQAPLALEHRLQQLKELKDKGLISEEAYDAKLQQLLSEL